jgi:hypothetical protein
MPDAPATRLNHVKTFYPACWCSSRRRGGVRLVRNLPIRRSSRIFGTFMFICTPVHCYSQRLRFMNSWVPCTSKHAGVFVYRCRRSSSDGVYAGYWRTGAERLDAARTSSQEKLIHVQVSHSTVSTWVNQPNPHRYHERCRAKTEIFRHFLPECRLVSRFLSLRALRRPTERNPNGVMFLCCRYELGRKDADG